MKRQQLKPFVGKCSYTSRCMCCAFFLSEAMQNFCRCWQNISYIVATRNRKKKPLQPAVFLPRRTEWKWPTSWPYLEVSVDDEAIVHVLQTQDDFSSIETHLLLAEHAVLRQVVVQVAPCKRTHKHAHKHTNKLHQWDLTLESITVNKLYQTFWKQRQESIKVLSMTIFSPAPSVLRYIECLIYFAHSGCNITAQCAPRLCCFWTVTQVLLFQAGWLEAGRLWAGNT